MKYSTTILLLTMIFSTYLYAQQNLIKPVIIENIESLQMLIEEEIASTRSIDFTGDNKSDFICTTKQSNDEQDYYYEYWISSEYEIIKKKMKYFMDFDEYWFIDLDSDPEPEIFWATGYSDGTDHIFVDQDLENGVDKDICYFNPVIIDPSEKKKYFWGYFWDITDLMVEYENTPRKILCSINHDINRSDSEIIEPEWQKCLPVICFSGKSTQPSMTVEGIRDLEWMSLKELIEKIVRK